MCGAIPGYSRWQGCPRCWKESTTYENDVWLLPRQSDEKVATLHLPTLDAELICHRSGQAVSIGLDWWSHARCCAELLKPVEIPQVQFLDKLDTPVMRVFFDQVVDVPVVLCNGISQVQFIDGCDVPMIMRGKRYSARSSNRARQWQLIRAELPSNGYPQPSGSSKKARQWHFIRAQRSPNGSCRSHQLARKRLRPLREWGASLLGSRSCLIVSCARLSFFHLSLRGLCITEAVDPRTVARVFQLRPSVPSCGMFPRLLFLAC